MLLALILELYWVSILTILIQFQYTRAQSYQVYIIKNMEAIGLLKDSWTPWTWIIFNNKVLPSPSGEPFVEQFKISMASPRWITRQILRKRQNQSTTLFLMDVTFKSHRSVSWNQLKLFSAMTGIPRSKAFKECFRLQLAMKTSTSRKNCTEISSSPEKERWWRAFQKDWPKNSRPWLNLK